MGKSGQSVKTHSKPLEPTHCQRRYAPLFGGATATLGCKDVAAPGGTQHRNSRWQIARKTKLRSAS